MLFDYIVKNKKEIGAKIMIVAMLLALFPFVAPAVFKVLIEHVQIYDNYYYSIVKILSWCVFVLTLFFFGFAVFLRGEKNENDL